jgi:hypothetical protein
LSDTTRHDQTLDEIAADPEKAATLTHEMTRVLHGKCVVVLTALLPNLADLPAFENPASKPETRLLTPAEASLRFNIPRRWLLEHAGHIPGTVKLTRKTVRFNEIRLGRWLERHRP